MGFSRLGNGIARMRVPLYLRVFLSWFSFLLAMDASIALNRWWLAGGFETYVQSLVIMLCGFAVFVILFSRSKVEVLGYAFFCVAVYFIGNYEIGGPSKFYLTPLDPALGLDPAFMHGSDSTMYRKGMAIGMSLIAAVTLAISKLKPLRRNAREASVGHV